MSNNIIITDRPKIEYEYAYLGDKVKVFLDKQVIKKCFDYAENKRESNKHCVRKRSADPEKMFKQDAYSKASEFAVSEFLSEQNIAKLEVDLKIYKSSDKSWDADLGKSYAVKSTSSQMSNFIRRGTNGESKESWMFQYSDNDGCGGRDRNIFDVDIENQSKKFVIFSTIEHEDFTEDTCIFIRGLVRLKHLHKHELFKDPIAEKYKGRKKNIYDHDLKELQIKMKNDFNQRKRA